MTKTIIPNNYADLVNPHIGGIGHLLKAKRPNVMRPHGMTVLTPLYTPGVMDCYLAETIHGFPLNASSFLPDARAEKEAAPRETATFDRDRETMKCYYGDVLLEDSGVRVEYTAGERVAVYRVTFPAGTRNSLALTAQAFSKAEAAVTAGSHILEGYTDGRVRSYFYAETSEAPATAEQDGMGALLTFEPSPSPRILEIKVGCSYIDANQAKANLHAELDGVDFERAVELCRDAWNTALGAIEVFGGTEDERVMFYTALYRVMNRMQNISEQGRYFSGYHGKVHDDDGHGFYVNDGIWDTYRGAHPLQLLINERRQTDMIHSYLSMYGQCGWLPSFPHLEGNRDVMLGKHATAMIVDAWRKGCRDFDINLTYEAMLKNADAATKIPWTGGPVSDYDRCYFENGFFPALREGEEETLPSHPFERRQCVAVTLETCYDDWCLAQIAQELGHADDYERLMKRAQNYREVYNTATDFMSPRMADGAWAEDFNPKLSGGQGGRAYFAECNAWTYTWHVQHDVEGLMTLMGGAEAFCSRLDALFREQYETSKYTFLGQFPDSTGLIGQFCMGNEPSFHIPYLYNYGGKPWMTQRRVREIMRLWFSNGPLGICGDEDGGAMSAWYAFSAMGLYPTCPGKPVYDIGNPIFDEVRIHMDNGNTFTITARNQRPNHKYINGARLNGAVHNSPWINHEAVAAGGVLELEMGLEANKEWGAVPCSIG